MVDLSLKKHWNRYALFWEKIMLEYSDYHRLKQEHIQALLGKKKILDVGAGTGNVTYELLRRGKKVYAVDISKEMLKILQEKCKEYSQNLVIKQSEVSRLSWVSDNYFDGINSMIVLPYVENVADHIKELYRILEKNGVVALSTNDPNYKDNFSEFIEDVKNSVRRVVGKEILNKFIQQARYNYNIKARNWFTPEQLKKLLLRIGFSDVSKPKYFGRKVTYFIKIKK